MPDTKLDADLQELVDEYYSANGQTTEMLVLKLSSLAQDARDRLKQVRGGEPGPYEKCTDCDRAMVWNVWPDGRWMCPRCVLGRLVDAEYALANLPPSPSGETP